MQNPSQIKCPNCGTQIDVQDVLAHQLEDEIKQKYERQLAEERGRNEAASESLRKAQDEFELKKKKENELFKAKVEAKLESELKAATKEIESSLRIKLDNERGEQFDALQKELNEKATQLKEFNKNKAEIERLKRENAGIKEEAEAEVQKKLSEALPLERERIRKLEEDRHELKFKELQKQLEDQKRLTEEMKRKQEQGSMQLQGEVQELAIEEWLIAQFPLDTIDEIKKGARGADCLHIVHTRQQQNCGKIYYESKRTKDFQAGWIEKFKADMRDKGADVGILVTEAMPTSMERMGILDGVWVCTYEEFKGLSGVIRESVIQLSMAISSQENKGDKMHMLYDYLTSNTFRMQVEAIVEGFSSMRNSLESEKRSMQRIWKEREKQIDKVTTNTIEMYGSIKGIAGSAIQSVKALELAEDIIAIDVED